MRLQTFTGTGTVVNMDDPSPLAEYLRQLRENKGMSLRDVARATESVVSNAYLSQLETGRRPTPNPRVLTALAKVYGVAIDALFEKAGYVNGPTLSDVDVAFEQVLADHTFQFGTRFPGELNEDAKRIIIELYEAATGKKLLP
jgi:transcriptional regulator with XRE-family HTH domain